MSVVLVELSEEERDEVVRILHEWQACVADLRPPAREGMQKLISAEPTEKGRVR